MQTNWYVLYVHGGDEGKICRLLCENGLEAFIPRMKIIHRIKGVSSLVERPMFPGYVFVESELDQNEFIVLLNQLRTRITQMMKMLKFDNEGTSALRPEEQNYLQRLLNEEKVMDHSIGIIEGGKTIVTEGPLKGLESTIIKIDRHKRKAIIEVMICNQPKQIKVSLEIISKTI